MNIKKKIIFNYDINLNVVNITKENSFINLKEFETCLTTNNKTLSDLPQTLRENDTNLRRIDNQYNDNKTQKSLYYEPTIQKNNIEGNNILGKKISKKGEKND